MDKLFELLANGVSEENIEAINAQIPEALEQYKKLKDINSKLDNIAGKLTANETPDEPETPDEVLNSMGEDEE